MNSFQFETLEAGVEPSPIHSTFMEAWNDMYKYVKAMIDAGDANMHFIETAIWIKNGTAVPYYFCEARDRAISEFGWIKPA